jgi:fanconi-associated nuclease 1
LVIQHYENEGFESHHTEGSIFSTLFGLLFWDIIYMNIPFVFQTKFQTAPLDFRTDAFYPQRKEFIDARIEELKMDNKMEEIMKKTWEEFEGKANACVQWQRNTLEELVVIAKSAGGKLIGVIMKELAKNFKKTKGMPDLIVFDEKEFKFCEVKSQRDHLSDHQRIWIDLLIKENVQVEIGHVVEKLPKE